MDIHNLPMDIRNQTHEIVYIHSWIMKDNHNYIMDTQGSV